MHAELLALSLPGLLVDVGRSMREAFYMFWDTLWALVLGGSSWRPSSWTASS